MKRIEEAIKTYFEPFVGKGGTTWSFEFKAWGNKSIDRAAYLDMIFKLINTDNSGNSVDLKNADHSVFFELIRDQLAFGILPRFKEFKRYNLTFHSTKEDDDEEK